MPYENLLNLIAKGFESPTYYQANEEENALRAASAKTERQMIPENVNWLREQRGLKRSEAQMKETMVQMQMEKYRQEMEDLPFKREEDAIQFLVKYGGAINLRNYPDSRASLIKRGINPNMLPPPEYWHQAAAEANGGQPFPELAEQLFTRDRDTLLSQLRGMTSERPYKGITEPEAYAMGGEIAERVKAGKIATQKPPKIEGGPAAVKLAIKQKFGSQAFTDPQIMDKADKWLDTDEGRASVRKNALDLSPGTNIFIGQTPEGDVVTLPGKGTPTPVVTPGPKQGIGPKVMSEDTKKDISAIGQAEDLITGLENQWKSLKITDRTSAVTAYMGAKAGTNPDAKLYSDTSTALLGNLSRSLAAERGVLTDQDIRRVVGLIAQIGMNPMNVDNKVEGEKKWKQVHDIIQKAKVRMESRQRMTPANPSGEISGTKKQNDPLGIR